MIVIIIKKPIPKENHNRAKVVDDVEEVQSTKTKVSSDQSATAKITMKMQITF